MLVVWLPLNGDLHNQGLSNITVTNNGATVDNSGKIGKCYSVGSSKRITSTIDTSKLKTNSISFACWVYITSWNSSYDSIMSIADGTGWNQSRATLCRNNTASTLTWNIANNSASARVSTTTSISLNTWTHIAATYDGATLKIYLNGVLNNSAATTLSIAYAGTLNIGSWTNANNYPLTGKINDVRVYDHALSPKEVEEIAKGLVLHYQLDDRFCEPTTNLAAGVAGYNFITKEVAQYATSVRGKTLYGNKVFTYSAYIKNTSDAPLAVRFNPYNAADSNYSAFNGNYIQPGQEGYSSVTVDITNTSNWNGKVILYVQNGNAGTIPTNKTFYIREVQVEEKNHATPYVNGTRTPTTIYDSSGYSHNGTITGSLTAAAGSPRYEIATQFPGNAFIEAEPLPATTLTISAWVNFTDTSGSAYRMVLHDKNSGLAIGYYSSSIITYVGSAAGGTGSKVIANLTANTWYHIVVVKTGDTTRDTYINGEKATVTSNNWWGGDLTKFNIGCRHVSGSYSAYTTGKIVDVRAYTTALTVDQIKELYNTSMSIDSNGNVYARELSEL